MLPFLWLYLSKSTIETVFQPMKKAINEIIIQSHEVLPKVKKFPLMGTLLGIFFFYWIFLDANSWTNFVQNWFKIKELKAEIAHYEEFIEESKNQLNELNSNESNLEKFARENFLMKQSNEDIYLVNPRD